MIKLHALNTQSVITVIYLTKRPSTQRKTPTNLPYGLRYDVFTFIARVHGAMSRMRVQLSRLAPQTDTYSDRFICFSGRTTTRTSVDQTDCRAFSVCNGHVHVGTVARKLLTNAHFSRTHLSYPFIVEIYYSNRHAKRLDNRKKNEKVKVVLSERPEKCRRVRPSFPIIRQPQKYM